jgi:hypothetical protein
MTRICFVTFVALFAATPASAQSRVFLQPEINKLAGATPEKKAGLINALVDNAIKVKLGAAGNATSEELKELLAFRRADIQTGSGSGASGTTSAVSSPLLPAIFGMAFETGGLTRTVTGSTVTLKLSPAGLFCASREDAAAVAERDPDVCTTDLKRVGITAAFDTNRGEKGAELANFETAKRQFAELGVRVELINKRQPASVRKFVENAKVFADTLAAFRATHPTWFEAAEAALEKLTSPEDWSKLKPEERVKQLTATMDTLLADLPDPPESATAEWLEALRAEQLASLNRTVVTAEYTYQQPDLQAKDLGTPAVIVPAGVKPPALHTGRLIVAKGLGGRTVDFTMNLSGSWFSQERQGMTGQFRDFRSALEVKFKMRDIRNYGAPTLSFAGLYVFLNQEPLGLGLTAFNSAEIAKKGHIYLFQTKLEFPTANNGIRIPISISASNRSELIKESDVRGQVGISFNLDSMFGDKKGEKK